MKVMREEEKRMKEMGRDGRDGKQGRERKGRKEGGRKEKGKNKGGKKVNQNRVEVRKSKGFGARKVKALEIISDFWTFCKGCVKHLEC